MPRIVQMLSHSVESFDQLSLWTHLGYEAVDIGGYIDPRHPHDPKRPPVEGAPYFPELHAAIDALGTDDNLGNAQRHLPDLFLEWLGDDGAIAMHHRLDRMIEDWPRLRDWMRGHAGRRVIWRTVGQSVEANEREMAPLRADGLEIVRYSPKEASIPGYLGADAIIRFQKDPADWYGWTGEDPIVIQFVQNFRARREWCNRDFFEAATEGLPRAVYGPQSDELEYGGGQLGYDEMRARLRTARAYLYTGTQPASYTLGLIEAMMTGVPVVPIEPGFMRIFPYGPDLFEGHEIAGMWSGVSGSRKRLGWLLGDISIAQEDSASMRQRAIELFGREGIGRQWAEFLG